MATVCRLIWLSAWTISFSLSTISLVLIEPNDSPSHNFTIVSDCQSREMGNVEWTMGVKENALEIGHYFRGVNYADLLRGIFRDM